MERVKIDTASLTLCFIDYPLEKNYFVRTLQENIRVVTFYEAASIFNNANIDLKNYVLLNLCRAVTLFWLGNRSLNTSGVFHHETRGCIFDMCGLKADIVISAANPWICEKCTSKIQDAVTPLDFLKNLKRELRSIKKSLYYRVSDWVKKHPVLSLTLAALASIFLGLVSSGLYDLLKGLLAR